MNKSQKRTEILNQLVETIESPYIYNTIDYVKRDESYIKSFIYPHLVDKVKELYTKYNGLQESTARVKAEESVTWEGDKKSVVHNMNLFGTQHRTDMEIKFNGLNIAVEFKKGHDGSSIRDLIGQSIVYSQVYDFVISLMIDTSPHKNLANSIKGENEQKIIEQLWEKNNVILDFV